MEVFRLFESAADQVWDSVEGWTPFAKNTLGDQLVRAVDSINANLVEGDGRFSDPDAIRFFLYARASAREARLWVSRAAKRNLMPDETASQIMADLSSGMRLLNSLVRYRRESSSCVREEGATYQVNELLYASNED